ncbi:MAG: molybdopterin-dependent oxidoreductase [Gemmatimonadales bacterium]|nr:molybdopterin-dependent oxidoreductase [Gemmatimonadales bacterium]
MTKATLRTTCPLDCPDACTLDVTVEGGEVVRIEGSPDHAVTAGFICSKVRGFARHVRHESRLLYPMRRIGRKGEPAFERITWDEAIETIAHRFGNFVRKGGGEAVLPYHYGGSNGVLTDSFLDYLFFARLGASRMEKTLCAAPATAVAVGMYGKMPGVAFEDYPEARCIVLWGGNPKVSNIHLMPFLKEARRRGAFVAVVDPVRTLASSEADLHLPVLPGADLPLALAMIRLWEEREQLDRAFLGEWATGTETLLERAMECTLPRAAEACGVPAADIDRAASELVDRDPAVIRCGWGLERNRNGGQAIAAILAMPALLGKFGVRGGGYTLSNSGAVRFDRDAVLGPLDWKTRTLNQSELGKQLTGDLDPAIDALFVYNCNPAVNTPHQNRVLTGLAREDLFTVVFDQVMTDTALYADIVLPATTFLEHWDVRVAYGRYAVGLTRPAIAPAGEAKSNVEVFGMLGRAMDFGDAAFGWSQEAAAAKVLDALRNMSGERLEPVDGGTTWRPAFAGGTPVQFGTVFPPTADRKAHLAPAALGPSPYRWAPVADGRYPLMLISPATSKTVNSTMGQYALPELYVEVHPEDARRRSIADGDQVCVFNDLGEVVCRARVTDGVRPGVVLIPKGAWRRASPSGRTATALCPDHVSAVGGGACYNDARVQLRRNVQ